MGPADSRPRQGQGQVQGQRQGQGQGPRQGQGLRQGPRLGSHAGAPITRPSPGPRVGPSDPGLGPRTDARARTGGGAFTGAGGMVVALCRKGDAAAALRAFHANPDLAGATALISSLGKQGICWEGFLFIVYSFLSFIFAC